MSLLCTILTASLSHCEVLHLRSVWILIFVALATTIEPPPPQRRTLGSGGGGAIAPPPQILADHLTLFQPGEADFTNHITTSPSRFQTFLQPCLPVIRLAGCYIICISSFQLFFSFSYSTLIFVLDLSKLMETFQIGDGPIQHLALSRIIWIAIHTIK